MEETKEYKSKRENREIAERIVGILEREWRGELAVLKGFREVFNIGTWGVVEGGVAFEADGFDPYYRKRTGKRMRVLIQETDPQRCRVEVCCPVVVEDWGESTGWTKRVDKVEKVVWEGPETEMMDAFLVRVGWLHQF